MYALLAQQPHLFLLLNDLVSAITTPHISPISCGRVIDGVRKALTPNSATALTGWSEMHRLLNIDKDYQKFISDHSKDPRHGGYDRMSGTLTDEIVERTWKIMDRFLAFKKGGDQALAAPEFP